jgi:transposase-like protein
MRQRTSYPKPFKAQVVQECLRPGALLSMMYPRLELIRDLLGNLRTSFQMC